jgi:mRNA interferase MazF
MITSAENRPWPDDIPFGESYPEANFPAPSIARPCKLATIEGGDAEKIGRVNAEMMEEVVAFLRRAMLGG